MSWCLEGDLNPHTLTDTWFWVKRVCRFRHPGICCCTYIIQYLHNKFNGVREGNRTPTITLEEWCTTFILHTQISPTKATVGIVIHHLYRGGGWIGCVEPIPASSHAFLLSCHTKDWYAPKDSNLELTGYKPGTLTIELRAHLSGCLGRSCLPSTYIYYITLTIRSQLTNGNFLESFGQLCAIVWANII